jgi:hypothetical protein
MTPWLLLVGLAHAKCAPTWDLTLRGPAPPDSTEVCVQVGEQAPQCVAPKPDGTFEVDVTLGISARGGLFGDRCRIQFVDVVVRTNGPSGGEQTHALRQRDVVWETDRRWILLK